MKRLRIRVIFLVCWLVVFLSAERLLEPVSINNDTYSFVLFTVIITLIVPRFARTPLWLILSVLISMFLVLKALTRSFVGDTAFLVIITEGCAVALTILLVYWVSNSIKEFESAVAHIIIGRRDKVPESASVGQGYIYREVRRARNHQRPLALMAIAVEEKSIKVALDRMVEEAQLAMMKQYTLSGVSKTLCDKLEDCDIVVQCNNHFLVVLPETTPEDMPFIIERLCQEVVEQVGVNLKIGTASLLQDGLTMEGLVDKATQEMEADQESQPVMELKRLPVEQHIN